MKTRIFRALMCFVLVCALLISVSPIRAKAVAAEVTLVYVGATLVCAAAITALGVQANSNVTGLTSSSKEVEIVLGTLGAISKDSFLACLRVLDETGKATYYMSCDLLESIRCALFDTGIVQQQAETYTAGSTVTLANGDQLIVEQKCTRVQFVGTNGLGTKRLYEWVFSEYSENLTYYLNGADTISQGEYHGGYRIYKTDRIISANEALSLPSIGTENIDFTSSIYNRIIWCYQNGLLGVGVAEGFEAGLIPNFPVNGSSALKWSEEYGSRQLRVITPNNSGDPDDSGDDNKKTDVYLPIALAGSIVEIAERTQADQWTGETPQEFQEYSPSTEYEILNQPQIDGFPGIEISPVVQPDSILGGSSSNPEGSFTPSEDVDYSLDLTQFFPFCIPFDLYEFFSLLAAEPEAPVFQWVIPVPQLDAEFPISIDLSAWDGVASLFRTLELLAFIVGLAILTRDKIIRG